MPSKSTPRRSPLLLAASLAAVAAGTFSAAADPAVEGTNPNGGGFGGFDLPSALARHASERRSSLLRSLVAAGFAPADAAEGSAAYLDFATRAIDADAARWAEEAKASGEADWEKMAEFARFAVATERSRIARLRRGEGGEGGGGTGTCAAGDEKCAAATGSEEFGHFLTPDLPPGRADPLRWDDGAPVQDYAARVGLPPRLVPTLIEYARGLGLYDIMENMLYDDPLPPGGARWFDFRSPYQKELGTKPEDARNVTWNVERPEKKWKSDMHWFNTADEMAHEDALRALARGGFDAVLKGIGEAYDLDTLHVDSFGFVAVTNCERGFVHTDWDDVDGRAFNFLVGIRSPPDAGPELVVENDRRGKGEVYYGSNAGVLVGDGTRHGTRECDHRAKREVRVACSIYLADPTEDNLETLAGDATSIFPPTGAEEWTWGHRGRHWRRGEDGGDGLVGDRGRKAFDFDDDEDGCAEEDCGNDTERGRNRCLRTCGVFVDDEVYRPGVERREVMGY
ncbi:hypothetical protein ACHAWF_012324 [Thalassiosira exigua]